MMMNLREAKSLSPVADYLNRRQSLLKIEIGNAQRQLHRNCLVSNISGKNEAKRLPLSIEVGLWGNSPRKTWAMAKNLNIHKLTLVLHPNTNINIPTQLRNDIEFMHGNKNLRKLRGVQAVKVIWVLKTGGVRMYKKHWVNAKVWEQKLQVTTRPR